MRVIALLLIIALVGCQKQPHSKEYIYTLKDDQLSLQSKINILRKSTSVNDAELLVSIALLYAQNSNWNEASFSISEAIKRNPLNASYHLYLANYNAELGYNIEAYNEAKIALELGTYDKKLEALIARMSIETSDTVSAGNFVAKYYINNRDDIEAQLLMARLYFMQSQYSNAVKLINQVLKEDSLNLKGLEVAYKTYLKLDSVALAINYGNKLLAIDSTNALYYYQLAELYYLKSNVNKAANYFAKSYQYQVQVKALQLALRNYTELVMYDSVIFYSDASFAGINYQNYEVLLNRARAFDKRYKYDESYLAYTKLLKMDSTDSVVNAEQQIVQRKIAYLQRKKREQKQLVDSLASAIPKINF